jgi:hypothetical protein
MKQILLICAVVALVGCGAAEEKAAKAKAEAAKAKAIAEAKAAAEANATVTPKPSKATVEKLITNPILEKAIRRAAKKPTGKLTKADLEKVTELWLEDNQLTDVKGLEKLTQLTYLNLHFNKLTDVKDLEKLDQLERLYLEGNPDLTKAQINQLQKALPKCKIYSGPTK